MKIISVALGTVRKWSKNNNRSRLLKYVKKLDVDGVEITFGRKEEVYSFKPSTSDIKFLKGLKYVSIHAPFRLIRNMESEEEVEDILRSIESLYKKVKAKNVIMHPFDIPEPEILMKFKFNVITENMPKIMKKNHKLITLEDVFRKYPKIGLCLDVAHAYRKSMKETNEIVRKFGNKIRQIHLSGTYRGKDHLSLKCVTKDFFKSIEPIKSLRVPLIIEEGFDKRNLKLLEDEIKLVRQLFL